MLTGHITPRNKTVNRWGKNYWLTGNLHPCSETDGNHRQTCIDKMEFDEKGLIKPVKITFEGVSKKVLK